MDKNECGEWVLRSLILAQTSSTVKRAMKNNGDLKQHHHSPTLTYVSSEDYQFAMIRVG